MAIEGPLRELGLQDVLQLLELARKTGVLTVRSERQADEGVIHLERGRIIFARRRRSRRLLGQQLLRAGKLTERELERALERQRVSPGQRLSEILLEMGSVGEEDLLKHLHFQLEENVYELMGWEEGYFRFEERSDVFRSGLAIGVRVESLLMEGARRIDEWSRLEAKISSVESVPVLAPLDDADSMPLELRPEEWEVLAEVDGERDVRQIAADLGRSTFDVGKILYGLAGTGVLRIQERASRISERDLALRLREAESLLATGQPEQAERIATELQASHPERAGVALLAGRALAAQGRMRAATEAFDRAVDLDPVSAEAHRHLGYAAVRIGELGRAREAFGVYLGLVPEDDRRPDIQRALDALETLSEVLRTEALGDR